jgi:DNA polymerase-3 subunit alpha
MIDIVADPLLQQSGISERRVINATADVEATTRCFLELLRRGHYPTSDLGQEDAYIAQFQEVNPEPVALIGLRHLNLKAESEKLKRVEEDQVGSVHSTEQNDVNLENFPFVHLHNHTQFSILQSTTNIKGLVAKAAALNMPAVALTDTGNMMAAFHFEKEVAAYNKKIKENVMVFKATKNIAVNQEITIDYGDMHSDLS